jgi:hypothetical protein
MFNPDGVPYYVGAGKHNRANPKYKIFNGRCPDFESRALCGRGTLTIVYEQIDKATAFAHEKELIAKYGRKDLGTGSLENRCDGKGRSGCALSEEAKERISAANTGRVWSAERRLAQSERMMGNTNLLGHHPDAETRKKISDATKGRKLSLSKEERERRAERIRNYDRKGVKLNLSEEERLRRAELMRKVRAEYIAKKG